MNYFLKYFSILANQLVNHYLCLMAKAVKKNKPRNNFKRVIPEGTSQVNFNLKNETLEKVNYIVYAEGGNKGELYNIAIAQYCDNWEAANGKIKPRPKGKGLS